MIAGAVTLAGIAIVYSRKRERQRVFKIGEDVVSKLGRDKYLGGEIGNGNVYCVPGTAKYVLRINTETFKCETVGPFLSDVVTSSLKRNEFKWLRAIRDRNGVLWGLPSNANRVIKITPQGKHAEKIEFVGPDLYPGTIWKWHGAQLATNGKIYAIPCNAPRVLCVNTETSEVKMIGDKDLIGRQKWYGGLYCSDRDGCIYGVPNCASEVLRIDPRDDTVTTFGEGRFPKGGYKWHGGVLGDDGCVYGCPSHRDDVLKIIPPDSRSGKPTIRLLKVTDIDKLVSPFDSKKHCAYKFGGGVMGSNDCVYFFPSDSSRVLEVNVRDESARMIGPEFVGLNKWQNGFRAKDGSCYAIPCNASRVLKIDRNGQVSLIGQDLSDKKEKWEGGVVGPNGHLYCMPQQANSILIIRGD